MRGGHIEDWVLFLHFRCLRGFLRDRGVGIFKERDRTGLDSAIGCVNYTCFIIWGRGIDQGNRCLSKTVAVSTESASGLAYSAWSVQ
jgi:hypothetical protein